MFKKAKKLNKIMSSLFMVALFGFFACTTHIFPSNHEIASVDKSGHHTDSGQDKIACVDHDTTLSNPNKNDHSSLDFIVADNRFINFSDFVYNKNTVSSSFINPPPKNKVPIFLKNSIFLI